jgi:hypothetical protein
MSRVNVSVDIPVNEPDKMIVLAENVQKRHEELGTASPLSGMDMKELSDDVTASKADRAEAKKLHKQAETKNQDANLKLGIDKSQNSKTPNTVYSKLVSIKDVLLGVYNGNEKKLSEFGFDVTIGTSSVNKKAPSK